jgi:preprotein translocase subunit SecA
VYKLEVVTIPTNRPNVRMDAPDLIYKNANAKWRAVVQEIKARHEKGQPVLVGTTSIAKNELLSGLLSEANIPHQVLNAKRNEEEGKTIAQAGHTGRVTVATNIAGRGVDIILGGNPPDSKEAEKVRELGGLYVLGTERHEARRIDNQLRGRAARQGDPGSTQFFLSLEDDLMRIFGGDRIKSMMERFDIPEDQPIQMGMVSSAVAQAQAKVEGNNFDVRKHLLEYDDVLTKQRTAVYKRRQEILAAMNHENLADIIFNAAYAHAEDIWRQSMDPQHDFDAAKEEAEKFRKMLQAVGIANEKHPLPEEIGGVEELKDLFVKRSMEAAVDPATLQRALQILDLLWMTHLEDLEALNESVGLRAYAQKDPLVEYREEARKLFDNFWDNFNGWIFSNIFKLADQAQGGASRPVVMPTPIHQHANQAVPAGGEKIGRNNPCPCGSGKKWKKCGLLNTEEHQRLMAKK